MGKKRGGGKPIKGKTTKKRTGERVTYPKGRPPKPR